MTTSKKVKYFAASDSDLVDEAVDQLNKALFTTSFTHLMTASPTESFTVVMGVGNRGIWLQDLIIGFNYVSGEYISAAGTVLELQMTRDGNFDDVTELLHREDFSATENNINGGALVSLYRLSSGVTRGVSLPAFIPRFSQLRFRVDNQEGVDRELILHVIGRPEEYELVSRPAYRRSAR